MLIYLAQRGDRILDTRTARPTALKPQTINLIKDLEPKIKIVSLYSAQGGSGETRPKRRAGLSARRSLQDLLNDYKRYGKNIDIDFIDPDASPTKVDGLIKESPRNTAAKSRNTTVSGRLSDPAKKDQAV